MLQSLEQDSGYFVVSSTLSTGLSLPKKASSAVYKENALFLLSLLPTQSQQEQASVTKASKCDKSKQA